jgi:hypothetical protein
VPEFDANSIPDLLKSDLDDLLASLGSALHQRTLGISGGVAKPRSALIEDAKIWLDTKRSLLKSIICSSDQVKAILRDGKNAKTVDLVATIADLISAHVTGVPPFVVAVLALRVGITALCTDGDEVR